MTRQSLLAAGPAALLVAAALAGPAAAAAYMKFEGVDGRVITAPVESAALDTPPAMRGCSGVLPAGTATVRMSNIRNPELLRAVGSKAPFKKAIMTMRKAGGTGEATLEVEMEDILITSLTSSQGPYKLSYRGGTWRDTACAAQ